MSFIIGVWFVCIKMLYLGLGIVFKKMNDWLIPDIITTFMLYLGICLMVFPFILSFPLLFFVPLAITLSVLLILFMIDDIKGWMKKFKD